MYCSSADSPSSSISVDSSAKRIELNQSINPSRNQTTRTYPLRRPVECTLPVPLVHRVAVLASLAATYRLCQSTRTSALAIRQTPNNGIINEPLEALVDQHPCVLWRTVSRHVVRRLGLRHDVAAFLLAPPQSHARQAESNQWPRQSIHRHVASIQRAVHHVVAVSCSIPLVQLECTRQWCLAGQRQRSADCQ